MSVTQGGGGGLLCPRPRGPAADNVPLFGICNKNSALYEEGVVILPVFNEVSSRIIANWISKLFHTNQSIQSWATGFFKGPVLC